MKKIAAAAAFLLLAACGDKDKNAPSPAPALTGGKGGSAVLRIYPQHHGEPIDSCMVYIKYASNDLPTAGYDDSARCQVVDDTVGLATFSGLKTGNYYLFGLGYDPAFGVLVDGGLPYNFSQEDTFTVALPVGEE